MTRKLYDEDPRLLKFEATVESCIYDEKKKGYCITLDQTAFFPEEGGQMPDRGTLAELPVFDVQIQQDPQTYLDTIFHFLPQPLEVGTSVIGKIDWVHRFDQMQQHSGEHIVSGLIHQLYHYQNVGFHLGAEDVTLDFNGVLTLEQLREIEQKANQAVQENFPVLVTFPDAQTLASLEYRSKIELKGAVRIVTFPGYDQCACCAPHVARTGEIGLIKITNVQSHRKGVRVNILCGHRALADYTKKQDAVSSISIQLSSKPDEVAQAVERLRSESMRLKEQICGLQAALMAEKQAALPAPSESRHALLTAEELDAIAARNTANQLADQYSGFGCLLIGTDESGYRFVIASRQIDCRAAANELRSQFQAKGGGSTEMIQGTIQISRKEFEAWMENH